MMALRAASERRDREVLYCFFFMAVRSAYCHSSTEIVVDVRSSVVLVPARWRRACPVLPYNCADVHNHVEYGFVLILQFIS